MKLPKLSVVVCTYNGEQFIEDCLISLSDQTCSKQDYEVIIVDNNSNDSSNKIIENYISENINFNTFFELSAGVSNARNKGILESNGKYIAFIDDDAKADRDWCENIIFAFENISPTPTSVGGPILPYYRIEKLPNWFNDKLEIRTWGDNKRFLNVNEKSFSGSNMSFPKRILEKVGGFNNKMGPIGDQFALGEENELFNRVLKKEDYLLWYNPAIYVYHLVPSSKLIINNRLERSKKAGVQNYKLWKESKAKLFVFATIRALFYGVKTIVLLLRFKFDYKVVVSLQRLVSKLSTIKLILSRKK